MPRNSPTQYWVIPKKIADEIIVKFSGARKTWPGQLVTFVSGELLNLNEELARKIDLKKITEGKIYKALNLNRHYGVTVIDGHTDFLDLLCLFVDRRKDVTWQTTLRNNGIDQSQIYVRTGEKIKEDEYIQLAKHGCLKPKRRNIRARSDGPVKKSDMVELSEEVSNTIGNVEQQLLGNSSIYNDHVDMITGIWRGGGKDIDLVQHFGDSGLPKHRYDATFTIAVHDDRISVKGKITSRDYHSNAVLSKNVDFTAIGHLLNNNANLTYKVKSRSIFTVGLASVKFKGIESDWFLIVFRTGDEGRAFAKFDLRKMETDLKGKQ